MQRGTNDTERHKGYRRQRHLDSQWHFHHRAHACLVSNELGGGCNDDGIAAIHSASHTIYMGEGKGLGLGDRS